MVQPDRRTPLQLTVIAPLPDHIIADAVARALAEDLGGAGDITTVATVTATARHTAAIVAREAGVISGLALATAAFKTIDGAVQVTPHVTDGATVDAGQTIATVTGPTRALLTGERTALNFLGHMSGIATLTRTYVDRAAGTKARIVDTRKTTPGLRAIEKYAVRCGGGHNHRSGLFDAVMIKDNHIAAGDLVAACKAARAAVGHTVKIEVEVDTLDQLATLLAADADARADIVLLDNMPPADLARAVAMIDGTMIAEASGGVTLATVRKIGETGVDIISVGALTHSARSLDLGFDFASPSDR